MLLRQSFFQRTIKDWTSVNKCIRLRALSHLFTELVLHGIHSAKAMKFSGKYQSPPPPLEGGGGLVLLKGQCQEIFCFFFSWISFPPAPEFPIRGVSNFFENSRRYTQLNVHHRCRWHRWKVEKIFNYKSSTNCVWTPLWGRVTYRYIFAF
jgi:hypothetical protein